MDDVMIRCLKRIDGNFGTVELNQKDIWKAIKRNSKKIRGMKGLIIGLGIGMAVLAAELMERKRSENYLNDRIDKLESRIDGADREVSEEPDDISGGVCDA